MEPVNKEIGQPDKFPSQALGLIETSLTTRDKASTSLWFSEKFFFILLWYWWCWSWLWWLLWWCQRTSDVFIQVDCDSDGNYAPKLQKKMIEYFVTFFFVCFGKTDQKEKTFDILMCTNFHESFPLTIRGDISQYIQIAPNIWVQSGFSDIQWLNTMTRDLFHSWSIWTLWDGT